MANPGTIRKETLAKLATFLMDFKERSMFKEYIAHEEITKLGLSSTTLRAMRNLNYAEKSTICTKYICKLKVIEPIHCRRIALENVRISQERKAITPQVKEVLESTQLGMSIHSYSDEQLFEELKARGFYGEVKKTVTVTSKI